MFDQTFVNSHARTRRPWTVAVSLALQSGLVGVALLAPLLHVATLQPPEKIPVWLPLESLKHPARQEVKTASHQPALARPVVSFPIPLRPSVNIPAHIEISSDAPALSVDASPGPPVSSFMQLTPDTIKPPPTSIVKPATDAPVHIGGDLQAAKLIFGPKPAYPPIARATRTQGTVHIRAIIGRDGSIRDLRVSSGPPLLIKAAIEAVRQWRYQPTFLNHEPVEVATGIDINFTISQ